MSSNSGVQIEKSKKDSKSSSSTSGSTKRGRGTDDEGWGGFKTYMDAKKYKLGEQFYKENKSLKSDIFQGVAIYVNGYTKPSSDELRRLITENGGKYEMYLSRSRVTHVVATNLPNSKFHLAKSVPVVRPEWITQSLAAGKRLPQSSYLTIDNKPKLQGGLKSFSSSSMSSLGRTGSGTAITLTTLGGSSCDSPSCSIPRLRSDNKPVSCVENYGDKETRNIPEDGSSVGTNAAGTVTFAQTSDLPENSLTDDTLVLERHDSNDNKLNNEIDKDDIDENELDIVYDSEDENSPQGFKAVTSRRFTFLNNPSPKIQPKSHNLIKSSSSKPTPQSSALNSWPSSDGSRRQSLPNTKTSDSLPLAYSPPNVQETNYSLETKLVDKSLPSISDSPSKPSPSKTKSVSSSNSKFSSAMTSSSSAMTSSSSAMTSSSSAMTSSSSAIAKAGDKGFLHEFYSNSRLHHLSTWGAEFKSYVADIQHSGDASFPGRQRLRQALVENATRLGREETLHSSRCERLEKTVMHIDMDCFFVSVGLLSRSDLKGKPVAVTHSRGQGSKVDPQSDIALEKRLWEMKKDKRMKTPPGSANPGKPARSEYDLAIPEGSTGFQTFHSMAEIASCSYEARQKGVKNGMYMGKAKTLCPELRTIPYDFDQYNRISRILYDIVASFTHDIEAVSCDEMFVDCTDVLADSGASAQDLARLLRKEVFEKTGCAASVGIGPNILLARLATRKAKPDGMFQVFKEEARKFIWDQAVSSLPGVGRSMSIKLTRLGVTTCGDLQALPLSALRREFGPKTGESLHRSAMGVDQREVRGDKQRKSVSADVNYGIRFTQESEAIKFLQELSQEVSRRLEGLGFKGRSVTLKLMVKRPDAPIESAKFMGHGLCNTLTKSSIFPLATSDGTHIAQEVISMYKQHRLSAQDVRGIGIQVQKLEGCGGRDQQTSGHQSILQFALSKKPLTTTTTTLSTEVTEVMPQATTSSGKEFSSNNGVVNGRTVVTNETTAMTKLATSLSARGSSDVGLTSAMNPVGASLVGPDVLDLRDVSFLLSPSQVSENVLDELPPDIAQELRNGIEQHRKRKTAHHCQHPIQSTSAGSHTVSHHPTPGTSSDAYTVFQPPAPTHNHYDANNNTQVEPLPSESQLDMSCFHALPRSLQKELEEAYAKRQTHPQTYRPTDKLSSPIKGTALEKLRSPTKDKGKKLKKKRGRPAGSRKGLHTGNVGKLQLFGGRNNHHQKREGSNSTRSVKDAAISLMDGVICLDDVGAAAAAGSGGGSCRDLMDVFNCHAQERKESVVVAMSQPKVEFCGVSSVKDVRGLFKEWIQASAEPVNCDVAMVTDYLTSLVHYKCLEQAFCLLKFLIRYVQMSSRPPIWKQCMDGITALVQSVVFDLHGSHFKLVL